VTAITDSKVWAKLLDRELRTRLGARLVSKYGFLRSQLSLALKTMIWIVWALLLVSHGALSRWAQTADSYAKVSVLGDVMLMAVALITLDQLQGLGLAEVLRVGVFFTAFGWAGRQLMGSVLESSMT
jgi:hypothetical protein